MYGAGFLLVIVGAIVVTAVAHRRGLQAPLVVMALASMASFIPGIPRLELPPEVILGVVVPPLLYSTVLDFSFVSFTRNLWSIMALGVGLVAFTAVVVTFFASWLAPTLPIGACLALGAVLAPSDTVTAVAVGRDLGLPKRLMAILTGESLVNDAAALALFTFSTASVVGLRVRPHNPVLYFAYSAIVGAGIGLLTGALVHWVRARLSDPGLETVLGMVVPFGAYLAAVEVHASGVLAVVAAGFFLGHRAADASFGTRLQSRQVWRSLDVLLEAFIFAYMGLQLPLVIADVTGARGVSTPVFVMNALLILLAVMLIRPVWIHLIFGLVPAHVRRLTARSIRVRWLTERLHLHGRQRQQPLLCRESLSWQYRAVMSWAGMRGVTTMAAAAAIPITTLGGAPFPGRRLIQASAFLVTVGTLLIQGSSLPPLIRTLNLADSGERECERSKARRAQRVAYRAARQATAELNPHPPRGVDRATLHDLEQRVEQYLATYQALRHATTETGSGQETERLTAMRDLIQRILAEQRRALVRERDAGRLDDEDLRVLLERLDYEEAAAAADMPNRLKITP
jgi:CPA1 family monovalent cation:H+ antiporter